MTGWLKLGKTSRREGEEAAPVTVTSGSGIFGLLVSVAVLVAFHALFVGPLERLLHKNWVQSPTAIMATLAHLTVGSIGSVWLSRIMPRLLRTK